MSPKWVHPRFTEKSFTKELENFIHNKYLYIVRLKKYNTHINVRIKNPLKKTILHTFFPSY